MTSSSLSSISQGDWLKMAIEKLKNSAVESPELSAQLILSHTTRTPRSRLMAFPETVLAEPLRHQADRLLARRLNHEPVAYLVGRKEFRHLTLNLTPDVLIPRPETEELVDLALELSPRAERIVDAGTGSGCIPLAFANETSGKRLYASDFSLPALRVAQSNDTERRVCWVRSDWLSAFQNDRFDLITANPPYLTREEMEGLDPGVRDYEPRAALDGGKDGCRAYRTLLPQAVSCLRPGGTIVLEIGPTVEKGVAGIARESGLIQIRTHTDLAGRVRFLSARCPGV